MTSTLGYDRTPLETRSRRERRRRRQIACTRRRRSATALLLALAIVFVPAASAGAGARLNNAQALTSQVNRNQVQVAFDVRTDSGPMVGAYNNAVARSMSCGGCNTVAIAVQIDLVSGPTTRIDATNHAEARTSNCIGCNTMASATQFVIAPGTDVHLTQQGVDALDQARARLVELASSGRPVLDLQPFVDSVLNDIQNVLQTEVVADGPAAAPDAGAPSAPTPLLDVMRTGGTVVARKLTDLQSIG